MYLDSTFSSANFVNTQGNLTVKFCDFCVSSSGNISGGALVSQAVTTVDSCYFDGKMDFSYFAMGSTGTYDYCGFYNNSYSPAYGGLTDGGHNEIHLATGTQLTGIADILTMEYEDFKPKSTSEILNKGNPNTIIYKDLFGKNRTYVDIGAVQYLIFSGDKFINGTKRGNRYHRSTPGFEI
jgi:hypothetical protein